MRSSPVPVLALVLAAAPAAWSQPCTSGSTILQLSTCTNVAVTNGAHTWQLSGFRASDISQTGYGLANGASAQSLVAVSWAPYTVGNQFGFSITFSAAGATNLFAATGGNGPRMAAFNVGLQVRPLAPGDEVSQYGTFITGWSFTDNTVGDVGPSTRVLARLSDPLGVLISLMADHTISFRNPVSSGSIGDTVFNVEAAYQIDSGENGATAALSSFTVYFLPDATVVRPGDVPAFASAAPASAAQGESR